MVDALASGASVLRDVEVQVLSRVPMKKEIDIDLFFHFGFRPYGLISILMQI